MLQGDDVYRIVWCTLLFAVGLPYTYKWLYTKRHIGLHLHNLAATLYFIDIVRRHSHPHNWFLNTPILAMWCVDKMLVGQYWRRRRPTIHRVSLSRDYMLICWEMRTAEPGQALQVCAVLP